MAKWIVFMFLAYIAYSQLSYRYESEKLTDQLLTCQAERDDAHDKKSKQVACKQESICIPKIITVEIPCPEFEPLKCEPCDCSNVHDSCYWREGEGYYDFDDYQ